MSGLHPRTSYVLLAGLSPLKSSSKPGFETASSRVSTVSNFTWGVTACIPPQFPHPFSTVSRNSRCVLMRVALLRVIEGVRLPVVATSAPFHSMCLSVSVIFVLAKRPGPSLPPFFRSSVAASFLLFFRNICFHFFCVLGGLAIFDLVM